MKTTPLKNSKSLLIKKEYIRKTNWIFSENYFAEGKIYADENGFWQLRTIVSRENTKSI